jgi:hypothetical protein
MADSTADNQQDRVDAAVITFFFAEKETLGCSRLYRYLRATKSLLIYYTVFVRYNKRQRTGTKGLYGNWYRSRQFLVTVYV